MPLRHRLRLILSGLGVRADPGDWLEPGRVLGCAYPRDEAALAALAEQGVSVLINLHQRAHDPELLARLGLSEVHLPLAEFSAPSQEQVELGVAAIERAVSVGQVVAVHCRGGLGRTGTLLACYLVRRGLAPADAIAQVRRLRPGSVETGAQVAAVTAYATRVASDRGQADSDEPEPGTRPGAES